MTTTHATTLSETVALPATIGQALDRAIELAWDELGEPTVRNLERRASWARTALTLEMESGRIAVDAAADALAAVSLLERIHLSGVESVNDAQWHTFAARALGWIESRPQSAAMFFTHVLFQDPCASSWKFAARQLVHGGASAFMLVSCLCLPHQLGGPALERELLDAESARKAR